MKSLPSFRYFVFCVFLCLTFQTIWSQEDKKTDDTKPLKNIDKIYSDLSDQLTIDTQAEVDAVIAFENHTKNEETQTYLYAVNFLDIDNDKIDEVLMEYSVRSADSNANWEGYQFLVFKITNNTYIPIIDVNTGSKYYRSIIFKEFNSKDFIFEIERLWNPSLSGEQPNYEKGDSIEYRYENGKFYELKE